MALNKQDINIAFSKGLDTKSDSNQIAIDNFLFLQNSVFTKTGALTKRNGYTPLASIIGSTVGTPSTLTSGYVSLNTVLGSSASTPSTTLTTLNGSLVVTGSSLQAYSQDTKQFINQGIVQPVQLGVTPLVRTSNSQTNVDAAVASNALVCTVYKDTSHYHYSIYDSTTGQQVVARIDLPTTATNVKVFVLGNYFLLVFLATVSATTHIQYIAIPIYRPSNPTTAADICTGVNSLTAGWDGYVVNNTFYVSFAGTGNTIKTASFTANTLPASALTPVSIAGHTATLMSVTADSSASVPVIWVTFYDSGSTQGYTAAYDSSLNPVLATTQVITNTNVQTLTSVAVNATVTVFFEQYNLYGYDSNLQSDIVMSVPCSQTGTVGSLATVVRGAGLASKAFIDPTGVIRMLIAYDCLSVSSGLSVSNQPSYFLIDSLGNSYLRLALTNGGGYIQNQVLPNITSIGTTYFVGYLLKDFLTSVSKAVGSTASAIYTQTGVNLAAFSINTSGQYSSEIANALHLTGGLLWEYDGVKPVEHGFNVYPENNEVTTSTSSGSIGDGTYYYSFCYEWTDAAGNLHRSAPSIPVSQVTSGGNTSTNTLKVPTLRNTYKTGSNLVRIVGYRYSLLQPVFYQFTSITSPTLNSLTVDFVTITDTLADASILGNTLLYTTGGVIEDTAAPACIHSTMFKSRLFIIDAEDRNLLWYSKQVLSATPVEMSDLLTLYVAPTIGAQQSTGPMTALGAMDDKLIIFKKNAIYYITGSGPDNTGASNDFSDPIFITASVGTSNPASVVLTPNGLMFQSDKGIWLLGRDLSTTYIGAPVEAYNSYTVMSANVVPGTTQVRFVMNNNVTLMYDYFYSQWGNHTNLGAISACIYNNLHTYLTSVTIINANSETSTVNPATVYQESPNAYLDGSNPVLLAFTTAWINIAGLQGFQRFYQIYLLGTYYTPFKLNVGLSYDYNANVQQNVVVTPDNYSGNWGSLAQWGSSGPGGQGSDQGAWGGGPGNSFKARVFPQTQKCESFQLSIQEVYDPSYGVIAGQGLSLSGMDIVVGVKRGHRTQTAGRSYG